jgi:hypothetical protein
MWVLIVLFVLLFLVLLVSMPLIVEARARIGVRGAIVHAKIYVLGLILIPLRMRVCLLSRPYFSLCIGKRRTSLLKQNKSGAEGIAKGVRIRKLNASVSLGIRDDPARATWYAGILGVALSMLIPRIAEAGTVRVHAAKVPMIRLSLSGSAVVLPVDALNGVRRARRIARAENANNTRKSKEKRTEYASS